MEANLWINTHPSNEAWQLLLLNKCNRFHDMSVAQLYCNTTEQQTLDHSDLFRSTTLTTLS